jgi:CBS domain-containing protein
MKANDIMTSPVVSIDPDMPVVEAARIMLRRHISGLPVIDNDGRLIGIVTEGDFLRRAETGTQRRRSRWVEFLLGPGRLADEYIRANSRKVSDVMTKDPVTITGDAPLADIVQLMERRRIKRLPVVDGSHVIGLVSRANLMHALTSVSREIRPTAQSDDAIREQLMAELRKQPWVPLALINVIVRDGVVGLWGALTDEKLRQALVVAAENVPGVKAVCDHLTLIDPDTVD